MTKLYVFRAPKDLKQPCISGIVSDDEKDIIFNTKIHIPKKYFKEKGTYEVIPIDGGFHPTNFQLYNGASFDISCSIFSGMENVPYYLRKNDRIQIIDNTDARNAGGKPTTILDKEARRLLIIDNFIVKDEGEIADTILKTKPVTIREIGSKLIPILYSRSV